MTLSEYQELLEQRRSAANLGYNPDRVAPLPATAPDGSPAKDLPLPPPMLCGCVAHEEA